MKVVGPGQDSLEGSVPCSINISPKRPASRARMADRGPILKGGEKDLLSQEWLSGSGQRGGICFDLLFLTGARTVVPAWLDSIFGEMFIDDGTDPSTKSFSERSDLKFWRVELPLSVFLSRATILASGAISAISAIFVVVGGISVVVGGISASAVIGSVLATES